MIHRYNILCVVIVFWGLFSWCKGIAQVDNIPRIDASGVMSKIMVDNKPFLLLGGEIGNSTSSTVGSMNAIWAKGRAMNLNTVLAPVYWELIEPFEGKFYFGIVDSLIAGARMHNLKLVLLWFGSWKNSMSSYVPSWMKKNPKRFQRTLDQSGRSMEILSVFGSETLKADQKAFVALMEHLKRVDENYKTVLMVQVENEIGMLSTAREHSKIADSLFRQAVPPVLMDYINNNKKSLSSGLKKKWDKYNNITFGNWESIFGRSVETDEIFQAWYYASYVNQVATAGKAVYNIPMYLNAALPRPGKLPGEYPSGGPLPHLIDIWKAGAPSIDMLSPDFYNPDIKYWSDLYNRKDNPLFIPEMQLDETCAAKVFYIIGHYHAIGFSPFSMETAGENTGQYIGNSYAILQQLFPQMLKSNVLHIEGFLLDKNQSTQDIKLGKYWFRFSHDNTLGWTQSASDANWPMSGGIILQQGEDEFLIGGTGIVATIKNEDRGQVTNLLSVQNVRFDQGKKIILSHYNGDQTHQGRHVRIPVGEWQIQTVQLYNSPSNVD